MPHFKGTKYTSSHGESLILIIFSSKVDITWGRHTYYDVINNSVMADLYLKHAKSVGVDFEAYGSTELPGAATDMGNVSNVVPSIHPLFYIGANVFNHTREFTEASGKLFFFCLIYSNKV